MFNKICYIFKTYSIGGIFSLIFSLILTQFDKILFKSQIRIIRRPFYIRGKKYISIGNGFTSGVGLRLDAFPRHKSASKVLVIDENVEVNDYVHIGAVESVIIGKNVLIASKVFISDHNHGFYGSSHLNDHPSSIPKNRGLFSSPVVIQNNVWIGEFVSILPGVTIGEGSIIGTMSVVSKSIPPNSIAVGSPAKVIKKYNFKSERWEKI